jgi:hypothetical protein
LAWHQALQAAGVLYFAFFAHQASQRAAQRPVAAAARVAVSGAAKASINAAIAINSKAAFMRVFPLGSSKFISP